MNYSLLADLDAAESRGANGSGRMGYFDCRCDICEYNAGVHRLDDQVEAK